MIRSQTFNQNFAIIKNKKYLIIIVASLIISIDISIPITQHPPQAGEGRANWFCTKDYHVFLPQTKISKRKKYYSY